MTVSHEELNRTTYCHMHKTSTPSGCVNLLPKYVQNIKFSLHISRPENSIDTVFLV